MNAEVEVTTAGATTKVAPVVVLCTTSCVSLTRFLPPVVASTLVPSQGSHSISAVAPDLNILRKELAEA